MGQQQLLLLVLGVVIVGPSVVIGTEQFGQSRKQSDLDLCSTEAMRIAVQAMAWRASPVATGGGLGASSFAGFTLASIGIQNLIQSDADTEIALEGDHFYSIWYRTNASTHIAVLTADYTRQAAVFLYGPSNDCLVMRTGWLRDDGMWTYVPEQVPPRPAGCAW